MCVLIRVPTLILISNKFLRRYRCVSVVISRIHCKWMQYREQSISRIFCSLTLQHCASLWMRRDGGDGMLFVHEGLRTRTSKRACVFVVAKFQYSFALSWWSSFSYATHISPVESPPNRHIIIYSMATNICRVLNDSLSLRIFKHVCALNCLHCGVGKYVQRHHWLVAIYPCHVSITSSKSIVFPVRWKFATYGTSWCSFLSLPPALISDGERTRSKRELNETRCVHFFFHSLDIVVSNFAVRFQTNQSGEDANHDLNEKREPQSMQDLF